MKKIIFSFITSSMMMTVSYAEPQQVMNINTQYTVSKFSQLLQENALIAADVSQMKLTDQQGKTIPLNLMLLQPVINHGLRVLKFNSRNAVGLDHLTNTSHLVLIDTVLNPSITTVKQNVALCTNHQVDAYVVKINTLQASDLFPMWKNLSSTMTLTYANHTLIVGDKVAVAYLNKTVPNDQAVSDMTLASLAMRANVIPHTVTFDDSFSFPLMNVDNTINETKTAWLMNMAFALGNQEKDTFTADHFLLSGNIMNHVDRKWMINLKKVSLMNESLDTNGEDTLDTLFNSAPHISELNLKNNSSFEMDNDTLARFKAWPYLTLLAIQGNDQIQNFSSHLLDWIPQSHLHGIGLNLSDDNEAEQFINLLSHKQFEEINIEFFPDVSTKAILNTVEAIARTQTTLIRCSTNLSLRYGSFSPDQLKRLLTARALIARKNTIQGGSSVQLSNNFSSNPINEDRPAHEEISSYFQKAATSWYRANGKFNFYLDFTRVSAAPSLQDKEALLKLLTQDKSSNLSAIVKLPISTVDKDMLNDMIHQNVDIKMSSSAILFGSTD